MRSYVDKFGDATKQHYMRYTGSPLGKFSNSATNNSKIYFSILINKKDDIEIMLSEYRANNPVKEHRKIKYLIDIKTSNKKNTLIGYNYSDRITLTKESSLRLHQNLLKNKNIKFYITKDSRYSTLTNYSFAIAANHNYAKAYSVFTKR